MTSREHATLSVYNNKSSVLCPCTTQITSQYLALEQLKAHYNMVSHAKGTVDTSPPKSLQSFLSSIDQKKKRHWNHPGPLPDHTAMLQDLSHTNKKNFFNKQHDLKVSQADNFSSSLNKSIQASISFPQFHSKVADKISWYLEAVSQGVLQGATASHITPCQNSRRSGSMMSLSSSLCSGKVIKGDIMDWHKKCFTSSERPFSPRILANNSSKSKILGMRCYNPPQKRKEASISNSSEASTFESFEDESEQDSDPKAGQNDDDETDEEAEEDEVVEEIKTEENMVQDTKNNLHIRESNIHKDWLKEQALRAQVRRKLSIKTSASKSFPTQTHATSHSDSNSVDVLTRTEEEMCLKFLSDVTEDILRSGIYSNSAIQRTFNFHLQFCPNESVKKKVDKLLHQIFEGLQESCEEEDTSETVLDTGDHAMKTKTLLKKESSSVNASSMKEDSSS